MSHDGSLRLFIIIYLQLRAKGKRMALMLLDSFFYFLCQIMMDVGWLAGGTEGN